MGSGRGCKRGWATSAAMGQMAHQLGDSPRVSRGSDGPIHGEAELRVEINSIVRVILRMLRMDLRRRLGAGFSHELVVSG